MSLLPIVSFRQLLTLGLDAGFTSQSRIGQRHGEPITRHPSHHHKESLRRQLPTLISSMLLLFGFLVGVLFQRYDLSAHFFAYFYSENVILMTIP
jgi:hypothetical protein